MAIPPVSEPYRETVGGRAASMDAGMEWAKGDPRKVAEVVVRIAGDDPAAAAPAAGSDAYEGARAAAARRAAEDARWERVSRSTDF